MVVLQQLLIGVALPAVLAASFLALSRLSPARWTEGRWCEPLAICAGYLGVHLAVDGLPALAPTDDLQWLAHLTLLTAAVGLVEVFASARKGLHWLLRTVLAAATFWLVLGFMIDNQWNAVQSVLWVGGLTAVTLAIISTFETLARKYPGASAPLAMVVLGAGSALVLVLIGTAKVAQLTGGLTAAAGVLWLFSLRRRPNVSRGTATAFVVLLMGLLAFGYMSTADIPALPNILDSYHLLAVLLVATAPFFLWLAILPFFERLSDWSTAAILALAVAVPLGAAVYLASTQPEEAETQHRLEGVDYDSMYQ